MQNTTRKFLGACLLWLSLLAGAWAQHPPVVPLRDLPDALKQQWQQARPEMNSNSRCAAAYDSHSDHERMTLKCSIYIKLAAEGARRAMRYCEEDREKKRIHAPCRLVQE